MVILENVDYTFKLEQELRTNEPLIFTNFPRNAEAYALLPKLPNFRQRSVRAPKFHLFSGKFPQLSRDCRGEEHT